MEYLGWYDSSLFCEAEIYEDRGAKPFTLHIVYNFGAYYVWRKN